MQHFIENIQNSYPIEIRLSINDEKRLSHRLELSLYRLISELINNSLKHSSASIADIYLHFGIDKISLTYLDNGKVFAAKEMNSAAHKGMGLINIRQRILSFNGQLEISSEPGKGMKLQADIPFSEADLC